MVGLLVQARRRRRAERELDERLRFETLLSDVTRSLARSDIETLDAEIDKGLGRLARGPRRRPRRAGGVHRRERRFQGHAHVRGGPGRPAAAAGPGGGPVPLALPAAAGRDTSSGSRVSPSCHRRRRSTGPAWRRLGTRAKVLIPLTMGGAPLGVLGLGMLREHAWPGELVKRLELSAEIFGSALMRRRFERLLEESRGFGTLPVHLPPRPGRHPRPAGHSSWP